MPSMIYQMVRNNQIAFYWPLHCCWPFAYLLLLAICPDYLTICLTSQIMNVHILQFLACSTAQLGTRCTLEAQLIVSCVNFVLVLLVAVCCFLSSKWIEIVTLSILFYDIYIELGYPERCHSQFELI